MARFRRSILPRLAVLGLASVAVAQTPPASPPASPNAPTLVTLHKQKTSTKEVFEELARQAKLPIRFFGDPTSTVTVDADAKPFCEVMVDVCRQSNTSFTVNADRERPSELIVQMQSMSSRTVVAGAVVAQFRRIRHWNRVVEAPESRDHCEIDVDLMWEPRLDVLFYERASFPTDAKDDKGHSLVPAGDPNQDASGPRYFRPYGIYDVRRDNFSGDHTRQTIRLAVGSDAGRAITHLSGTLRLFCGGEPKSLEIKNLKQSAKAKTALPFIKDTALTITDATVSDDRIELEIVVAKNPGEADDAWNRRKALLANCTMNVVDANGNAWASPDSRVENSFSTSQHYLLVRAERRHGVKSAPATLTLTAPNEATEVDIPYDFSNLPLP